MERTMDDVEPANWALSHGERLLVRTLRRLALRIACPGAKTHFELACGCAGEAAYAAMVAFVEQLRATGQRRMEIMAPPAHNLTSDERLILAVFAAAQADDYGGVDRRLAELVDDTPACVLGA